MKTKISGARMMAMGFADALAEAVFESKDLLDTLEQIGKELGKKAFSALIGSLFPGSSFLGGLFGGFADGGSFVVPGAPNAFDTKRVTFNARPGEQITVTPRGGGGTTNNNSNVNVYIQADQIDRRYVEEELLPMLEQAQARA